MAESAMPARRAKRFLSTEQKYEIRLKILTGELTSREAAAQVGVDRSTIMTLRKVGRDGAIASLQASAAGSPGRPAGWPGCKAENARLSTTIVEQPIELAALRGKSACG